MTGRQLRKWDHLLDSLLRYMDGDQSILDIAERHDLSFDALYRYLKRFEEKGLISLDRREIPRVPPNRVGTFQ